MRFFAAAIPKICENRLHSGEWDSMIYSIENNIDDMTNVLRALINSVQDSVNDINNQYVSNSRNRANSMGDSLESYSKDIFCGTRDLQDEGEKMRRYSEEFSYLGNKNNPPDIMIAGGDAIEIKKIESINSQIALNSSYPKNKIRSTSTMITKACRECEEWQEKDMIYVIGVILSDNLKALWFVHGDCYAADSEIYERVKNTISNGVNGLAGVEFEQTNELARVNRVDPLGITYLRVRGMWGIANPLSVFTGITSVNPDSNFTINAVILEEKYNSYPEDDRAELESIEEINISDVEIPSPNNPAELLQAKLINYVR